MTRSSRAFAAALVAVLAAAAPAVAAGTDLTRYDGTLVAGGTVAPDVTGGGHDATERRLNGGGVSSVVLPGDDDPSFVFPDGTCAAASGCPQAALVPTAPVNPTPGAAFTYGADVRLLAPATSAGQNVLQRGLSTSGTAQWKLQVDKGWPSCRWSDGRTVVLLPAGPKAAMPLAVDVWYHLECTRTPDDVFRLSVTDPATGELLRTWSKTVPTMGAIAPTGSMMIGTKAMTGGADVKTDQFHGALDDVFVSVG